MMPLIDADGPGGLGVLIRVRVDDDPEVQFVARIDVELPARKLGRGGVSEIEDALGVATGGMVCMEDPRLDSEVGEALESGDRRDLGVVPPCKGRDARPAGASARDESDLVDVVDLACAGGCEDE